MLARFALDPDAVLAASIGEHRRLIREWLRYGVLFHNGNTFADSELAGILNQLPQSKRILWKEILKKAWMKPVQGNWPGLEKIEDRINTAETLNGMLDLIFLEETRLEYVQDEMKELCPDIELDLLEDIDNSVAFLRAHELGEKRTDEIRVQELWKERFALPASLCRNIIIVDRFALSDGEGINGLEAFLVMLDGSAKKANVTLYSSFGGKTNLTEDDAQNRVAQISRERLARGGVGEINLFLTDSREFGKVEHDRFIKFDHLVFEVGSGMAVFNGRHSKQSNFSSKIDQDGHRNTVKELHSLCSRTYPVSV
ncbi:hypothetical protein [Pontiella sulfatireligans]|uniref:Uncharacterized protein n=1 Tax=Pontiella sulfatireligans TaxID=2750658 RepID=A0A6C2UKP2_9BACT|nr:hypothetical protein [Pontiella sulfatireligans]VGO19971.1 hypothetical protein SCARR_02031 [Pontiella sulfatireligans]